MKEIFEDLKGFEDLYQISENGRIFSKRRLIGNQIFFGRELKPIITPDGYLKVKLSDHGVSKGFYVHRLVAKTFIKNPLDLSQVNHIDGNKTNNNVSNLEWCTKDENLKHASDNLLMQHGADRPSSKLKESDVLEIYKLKGVISGAEIAKKYGVSKNTINVILRGDKWKYLYKQHFNIETT